MKLVLALGVAATSLILLIPPSARAGTFQVVACGDAASGTNHSWTLTNNAPSKLDAGDGCGAGLDPGLYARDVPDVSNAAPDASAQWTFNVPTGTSITDVSYSRWFYKEDDDDWQPALWADEQVVDSCAILYPAVRCEVGAKGGQRTVLSVSAVRSLRIGIFCAAAPDSTCVNGARGQHAVDAVLYGVTVSIAETITPALSGLQLTTDRYATGTQTATFSAMDNTGIHAGRIYVDDVLKASATYACDFTYAVPCSNKTDAEVALDTRSLSDGPHSVQVAAVDPAGNETRSSSRSIVVDNGAPLAPGSLVVDGGADWRSANSFDVSWVNPVDSGSPVASAHYELCSVDGSGCLAEQTASGTDVSRLAGISVPSPGAWALRVWLEDAAGNVDSAHAAQVTLRFGSAPADPMNPTTATPTDSSADGTPSPALNDPLTPPSLDQTTTPTPTSTAARLDPRLRLTSARLTRGRLVLRGRAATTATGRLALTIRLRGGRSLLRHVTIRGGRFSIVTPIRKRTQPRAILARFAGSSTFRPATASLRFRR